MSESESDYERFRRALQQEAAAPHPFAFYPKSDGRGDACPECGCAMALDDNELAMIHAERRVAEARQLAEWIRDNPDQAPIVTFPWEVHSTSDPAEAFARAAAFGSSHLIVEPAETSEDECRTCHGRKSLWIVISIHGTGELQKHDTGIPCPSCQPQDFASHQSATGRVLVGD